MAASADKVDVLVLGAGNAGLTAADIAREAGLSVAVVEQREVGGTCPLRGCVPKKVLVAAAEALDVIAGAGRHHIEVGRPRLNWDKLIERKQSIISGTSASLEKHLRDSGIELIAGRARFSARREVLVGDRRLSAGKIVVATGSRPRDLPFEGAAYLGTSDDVLELRPLPPSVVFIGGGVIALEFAHVLVRAGSQVTILELSPQILPGADPELAAHLRRASEKLGILIQTSVSVRRVVPRDGGFAIEYQAGEQRREVPAACVINGAGRVADVAALDLAAGGIEHDGERISVDRFLRSVSNHDVYVAGDAYAGSRQLSALATEEGQVAGENLVHGNRRSIDYLSVPAVVFTIPSLASVGHTERSARDAGLDFDVRDTDMSDWFNAELYGGELARARVLIDKHNGRILGAHLFGKRCEETIQLFALAMKHGLTRDQLYSVVYAFPTFGSDLSSML